MNVRSRPRNVEDFYPLAPMQQGMLFHTLAAQSSDIYCQQASCALEGALDVSAFRDAWHEVVGRHPVLRTSFVWADLDEPVQVVHRRVELPVAEEDWRALSEEEQETRLEEFQRSDRRKGFELTRAPLLRLSLIRLGERLHRFVWTYHHILLDGWSANRVLREVLSAYELLQRDEIPELPAPRPYRDYIAWLRRRDFSDAEDFWRAELKGFRAATPLVVDRNQLSHRVGGVRTEVIRLSASESDALRDLGRRKGLTFNTLVQAAWGLLLSRYSGEDDVVFGATVLGRPADLEGADEMVGVFINTLPVRMRLPRHADLAWLEDFQAHQAEARLYEYTPLVDIQGWSEVRGEAPLFESILVFANYQGERPEETTRRTLKVRDYRAWESSNYALNAFAEPGAGLSLGVVYDRSRFDGPTIRRLLGHWKTLLLGMLATPDARLADLPIVPTDERQKLLVDWNATEANYPRDICIHELFENRAAENPEVIAVVFQDNHLTYGALNVRANRLARHLRELGVRRGAYVGVFMRRSLDMVVSLLAILKAGGAYVPLEPDWPVKRVQWILSSLGVSSLITEQAQTRTVHDLQWSLPALKNTLYLDLDVPEPPPEPVDTQAVRGFWDHLAETATDPITAAGFISSYTGKPFSQEEVDEYVDRVAALAEPHLGEDKRVLEIGCGSGLIMFSIAPEVGDYVGLDPSDVVQKMNRERAVRDGHSNVELVTGFADEIAALEHESFDLVILASTCQFFPGPYYLADIIETGIELLRPDGAILVADVMDPRQKQTFQASLEEYAGQSSHDSDSQTKTRLDAELYVDEEFFHQLGDTDARIAEVSALYRADGFDNELQYRYDVIIRKAGSAPPATTRGAATAPRKRAWTGGHLSRYEDQDLSSGTNPEDIAYVIYTSGSTGVPKGVTLQHGPVVNLIDWVNRTYHVDPRDRLLWITSPCFDLSVYDVFGILGAGGSVHVASEDDRRNPERLMAILEDEPITFWDSAPVALQQVAPLFQEPAEADGARSSLRLAFLSGDWIPLSLPDALKTAFPGVNVIGLGGATEAAIWSNYYPIEEVQVDWASIPYGRPIQNARYYVLDPSLNPCPIGVPGDLYIGGPCLSLGYAGDPETTASSFIPDPFGSDPGRRLYKTGDRARFFPDGNIEFLGRVDQQVKIRGYRVETGEIEAVLGKYPGVRAAVVTVREDAPGDRRLVAYVVPSTEAEPTSSELRRFLRERVPDYMVPSTFSLLDAFPITANGKLDREALPAPDGTRAEPEQSYVPPRTEMEREIAAVWREVLRLEKVGLHDNFFDLGGHSLLLVKLHGKLQKTLRADLSIIELFRFPTVGSLSEHLSGVSDHSEVDEHGDRLRMRRAAIGRSRRIRVQARSATEQEGV